MDLGINIIPFELIEQGECDWIIGIKVLYNIRDGFEFSATQSLCHDQFIHILYCVRGVFSISLTEGHDTLAVGPSTLLEVRFSKDLAEPVIRYNIGKLIHIFFRVIRPISLSSD